MKAVVLHTMYPNFNFLAFLNLGCFILSMQVYSLKGGDRHV